MDGTVYQRLRLQNHGDRPFDVRLSFAFGSDFADLFEVRGLRRKQRGTMSAEVGKADVRLNYDGLDGQQRRTTLLFEPAPAQLSDGVATYALELQPNECQSVYVTVTCDSGINDRLALPFRKGLRAAFKARQTASRGMATITSSNEIFNEIMCRSMADLAMLTTATPQGLYPYAGIPWYSTTFGRDGIITALQMLVVDPRIARGVLQCSPALQAREFDPVADAEPGKILHEMRRRRDGCVGRGSIWLYYGSVDATPLFVMLAGRTPIVPATSDHRAPLAQYRAAPAMDRRTTATSMATASSNIGAPFEKGLVQQGWKDSQDAIFHADGTMAPGPDRAMRGAGLCLCGERLAASWLTRILGDVTRSCELEVQAETLRTKFEDQFWCEDLGTYALALDGKKSPCRVRASNAGHCFTPESRRRSALDRWRESDESVILYRVGNPHGCDGRVSLQPISYHNGSVWPHDNSIIAAGLARYGHKSAVNRVFNGLFEAASYMDLRRLPELYCGFQRGRERGPTLYPVACSPQAWAAGTPLLLLQSCLGLNSIRTATKFCCASRNCRRFSPKSLCAICASVNRPWT